MQHNTTVTDRVVASGRKRTGDVAIGDTGAGDVDADRIEFAAGTTARHRQHNRFKLNRSVALGQIDGMTHRLLGLRHIDHRAVLYAARLGMTDAVNLDAVATLPK